MFYFHLFSGVLLCVSSQCWSLFFFSHHLSPTFFTNFQTFYIYSRVSFSCVPHSFLNVSLTIFPLSLYQFQCSFVFSVSDLSFHHFYFVFFVSFLPALQHILIHCNSHTWSLKEEYDYFENSFSSPIFIRYVWIQILILTFMLRFLMFFFSRLWLCCLSLFLSLVHGLFEKKNYWQIVKIKLICSLNFCSYIHSVITLLLSSLNWKSIWLGRSVTNILTHENYSHSRHSITQEWMQKSQKFLFLELLQTFMFDRAKFWVSQTLATSPK